MFFLGKKKKNKVASQQAVIMFKEMYAKQYIVCSMYCLKVWQLLISCVIDYQNLYLMLNHVILLLNFPHYICSVLAAPPFSIL